MAARKNTLNPVWAALFSTAALGLLAGSGGTCSFLTVRANADEVLQPSELNFVNETSTPLGVFCKDSYYDLSGDPMWILSVTFASVGLVLTAACTVLSLFINTFLAPTWTIWKSLSGISALAAIAQVPVFLLYEAQPCSAYKQEQTCEMSTGSFLLIVSAVCSIAVTLITQCLDPPDWTRSLNEWRVEKDETDGSSGSFENENEEKSFWSRLRSWRSTSEGRRYFGRESDARAKPPDLEEGHDRTFDEANSDESPNWTPFPEQFFPVASDDGKPKSLEADQIDKEPVEEESAREPFDESIDRSPEPVETNDIETAMFTVPSSGAAPPQGDPESVVVRDDVEVIEEVRMELFAPPAGPEEEKGKDREATGGEKKVKSKKSGVNSKGYALMVDDDMESSFPISPPLEVVTFPTVETEETVLSYAPSTEHDEALAVDDWDPVAYFAGPISTSSGAVVPFEHRAAIAAGRDPAFDEQGYVRDTTLLRPVDHDAVVAEVLQNRSRRMKRRKKRKTKAVGVNSVASSPSLLDTMIQEETAADLKESDVEEDLTASTFDPYSGYSLVRTQSAPDIREYANITPTHSNLYTSVDGVNSYHGLEEWMSVEGHDHNSLPREVMQAEYDDSALLGARPREPIFREERVLRGGIHASPSFASELTEDTGSFRSYPSEKARSARIQRLQQMYRERAGMAVPDEWESRSAEADSNILDTLDLQLIQVQRPDGAEYGPDEVSL